MRKPRSSPRLLVTSIRNWVRSWCRRYDLREKDILEIGCGKGEFLTLLADLGNNRCIGFDPGYHEGRSWGISHNPGRVQEILLY